MNDEGFIDHRGFLNDFLSRYKNTELDITGILSRYQNMGVDLSKMASMVPTFIPPSIDPTIFTGILSRYQSLEVDFPKMASIFSTLTSSQLDMAGFKGFSSLYENNVFYPNVGNKKSGFSNSLTAVDEMLNEIKGEMEVQEETNLSDYSDEQVRFILKSFEDWLEGSNGFKSTLKRIKGSNWASNLMYILVIAVAFHIVHILLIIDDYQFQQDRIVLESIQTHLETNVLTYKLVKNLMDQDKINTYHSVGFNRAGITLREGRSKTAPIVVNGVIWQKPLILMLERKNNWRKVEVKIKGTYLQGWVPESSITRLEK